MNLNNLFQKNKCSLCKRITKEKDKQYNKRKSSFVCRDCFVELLEETSTGKHYFELVSFKQEVESFLKSKYEFEVKMLDDYKDKGTPMSKWTEGFWEGGKHMTELIASKLKIKLKGANDDT